MYQEYAQENSGCAALETLSTFPVAGVVLVALQLVAEVGFGVVTKALDSAIQGDTLTRAVSSDVVTNTEVVEAAAIAIHRAVLLCHTQTDVHAQTHNQDRTQTA